MPDTQDRLTQLEKRIEAIEVRNKRVELNKAWETSLFRKIAIALLTYFTMSLFFSTTGSLSPLKDAIVPTLGFLLSTFSLSLLKTYWERTQK